MQSLQRFTFLAIAMAAVAAIAYVRSGSPRAARPTAGQNIIAFGDSLVAGRGASAGRDFVSVLSARLGVPIINAGRSGDTTETALARVDRDVLSRNPRVVLVLLGGNDFLRRVPRQTTFANLATIVRRIRERGSAVVVVGVSAGIFTDSASDDYEALAGDTAAGFVADILAGIIGRSDLMSDPIHPNDRGHLIMADRLEPVLRELVEETAAPH
jgi:lysophospholipase L1-like esterase